MKKQSLFKRKKWLRILVIVLGIVLLLSFIIWFVWFRPTYDKQGIPTRAISLDYLRSRPESKLYYPKAKVLYKIADKQEIQFGGHKSVAFIGAVMSTDDPPERVYAWYRKKITALGWREDKYAIAGLLDTQTSIESYRGKNKRETFYVAMNDTRNLSMTLGEKVSGTNTVFEFRYMVR